MKTKERQAQFMPVTLSPQLKKWVNEKVASGDYSSCSELVREALRALREREKISNAYLTHVQNTTLRLLKK